MKVSLFNDEQEPLRQFSILRSGDPSEARDVMRRYGVEVVASASPDFFLCANLAELSQLGLYFASNTTETDIIVPERMVALVHLCLRGRAQLSSGSQQIDLSEGCAVICPPRRRTRLAFGAGFRQLVLRIPERTLERTVASLIGFTPQQQIELEPMIAGDDPRYFGFRDLVRLLAARLDPDFSAWPRHVLVQIEQTCITALLHCSRHNLRRLLDDSSGGEVPSHVRVAEHYADSHCEEDVSVDDMARAAGVSVSTLSRAFIRSRGYSPAGCIKRARLSRAKSLLENGSASTVVGVALRCGFANPSRFANDYRAAFGESPTETLRRCRPSGPPNLQKY